MKDLQKKNTMRGDNEKFHIIAVDFDGTICTDCYPKVGIPNLPLIQLLKEIRAEGAKLILWTCRSGAYLEDAVSYCKVFGLEFDAINDNLPEITQKYGNNSRKIFADVYIDDKSCFPWSWEKEQNYRSEQE